MASIEYSGGAAAPSNVIAKAASTTRFKGTPSGSLRDTSRANQLAQSRFALGRLIIGTQKFKQRLAADRKFINELEGHQRARGQNDSRKAPKHSANPQRQEDQQRIYPQTAADQKRLHDLSLDKCQGNV